MPAPIYPSPLPAAKTAKRISYLVQLFFGGSLAVVVLLLGLCAWRLGQLPPSHKPARERPEPVPIPLSSPPQAVVDIEPLTEDAEGVPKIRVAFSQAVSKAPAAKVVPEAHVAVSESVSKAPVGDLPRAPEPLRGDQIVEQRLQASEDDLRRELLDVPEVILLSDSEVKQARDGEQADQRKSIDIVRANVRAAERIARIRFPSQVRQTEGVAVQEQIGYMVSLRLHQQMMDAACRDGLELQFGAQCQLSSKAVGDMAELSKDLRDLGFVSFPGVAFSKRFLSTGRTANLAASSRSTDLRTEKIKKFQSWCDQHHLERYSGTIPTLIQMLQIEDEPTRLLLIRELTRIGSKSATVELAKRALADLAPAVRQAALAGLEARSSSEYLPVLLKGLRHPWPPIADHAAEALRTLKLQEVVVPLVDLLGLPSPSAPVWDEKTNRYSVRELVRLNHLRNCLLCHPPSVNKEDGFVRGLIPTPGTPLRRSQANGSSYYNANRGNFVRADTTFLHQDFSAMLPAEDTIAWPSVQRYDFVTRLRTLQPSEAAQLTASPADYPQREAVMYALRGLTGKDYGDAIALWREGLGLIAEKPKGEKKSPAFQMITTSPANTRGAR